MSYEIKWHPKAAKNFEKLPKELQKHISNKLELVKEDPFHYLEHFSHEKFYKLRIGDYRALVDVDFGDKILYIKVFDHRGNVYK